MKVLLFGGTGMVGQGVLRECLLDPRVERVLSIGRAPIGQTHDKLVDRVHADLFDLSAVAGELAGYDVCLFCLGVSSAGMKEEAYRRVTYQLTLHIAETVLANNPQGLTFEYVSGSGTDSTGKGRSMWARVKGETENALLAMPFTAAYMVRPAAIQPLHGVRSKTRLYHTMYVALGWLFPLLRLVAPRYVTTTEHVGRGMLRLAREGLRRAATVVTHGVVENDELDRLGRLE